MKYLKLIRVKHYFKNLLIFLPAFLIGEILNPSILIKNLLGVVVFSLAASIVYVVNDIRDVESDRKHPTKCKRPIASGEVSIKAGYAVIVLFSASIVLISILSHDFVTMILIPALYIAINILYSIGLKNIPLIDIFILMLGYLFRLEYGGQLTECGVSTWMFLTMMSVAFFMALGKRAGELRQYGDENRKSLKIYTKRFLEQAQDISCGLSIVFYAMTCSDTNSAVATAGHDLLWSVPIIVLIVFRYLMLIQSGENDGDPMSVIFKDKFLLVLSAGYVGVLVFLLYL